MKVAVIGLGNISRRHRRNIKLLFDDARVIAMSSSGRCNRQLHEDVDFWADNVSDLVLMKPDWVFIASPATSHFYHAKALLEHNIPILIEKPVMADAKEAIALQKLVSERNVPVSVGYCLRFMPSAQVMRKLLGEEKLGIIYNIHCEVGQYLPDWRPDKPYQDTVSASKELGGGALLELSHELDYLYWFFGKLNVLHGVLRNTPELRLSVEEIADVVLETDKGAICNLHMDFNQKSPKRRCVVIGEKGRLEWDLLLNRVTLLQNNSEEVVFSNESWGSNDMYLSLIREFSNLIVGDSAPTISTLPEATDVMLVIDQIKKSAEWRMVWS